MRIHTLLVACLFGSACAPMITAVRPNWATEAGTEQEVLARYKLDCTATFTDESCRIAGREVDMDRALAQASLYPETDGVADELAIRKAVFVTIMLAAAASIASSALTERDFIHDYPNFSAGIGLLSLGAVLAAVWQPLEDLAPAYNLALERDIKASRTQLSAR